MCAIFSPSALACFCGQGAKTVIYCGRKFYESKTRDGCWFCMNKPEKSSRDTCSAKARAKTPCFKQGFTLVEFMFASSLVLLLFLFLLEALFFARRSAERIKWQLAADAFAYDVAIDFFNHKTEWFEDNASTAVAEWLQVPEERTTVWLKGSPALYFYSIIPVGMPATHWQIVTDVQWPLPGGGFARLPAPYILERHRANRNLFRNTP